jgi:hypothetical protein
MPCSRLVYAYAFDVIRGRWPEAESIIVQDPYWSYCYARDVIKGRFSEAESIIVKNPSCACLYAKNILKHRWVEAESVIEEDYQLSQEYAQVFDLSIKINFVSKSDDCMWKNV